MNIELLFIFKISFLWTLAWTLYGLNFSSGEPTCAPLADNTIFSAAVQSLINSACAIIQDSSGIPFIDTQQSVDVVALVDVDWGVCTSQKTEINYSPIGSCQIFGLPIAQIHGSSSKSRWTCCLWQNDGTQRSNCK